ncbi:MAG: anaerobic ribonucleoside-triphosphate reductase [Candidatus Pacearchaeota archaeon]
MTAIPIEQIPDNLKEYSVSHTFNRNFINTLNRLHRKYGDPVFEVSGIANRNLDIALFSEDFFSKSVANIADVSVDDNANVSEKNISHYDAESTKALQKLNSIATMYEWVEKCYSKKDADIALEKLMNGEIFLNDATKYNYPYCFSFDLRNLLFGGMNFFKGNFKIHPPKRSDTFITLMIQTVAYISNQIAGAASFPDFFVCLDWYLRKEFGEDYSQRIKTDPIISSHLKNLFQNWIYSVNFPFRGAGQSAFTNLSVMDSGFMKALFTKEGINGQDYILPDNTKANVQSSSELSKSFFEYYTEINSKEGLFTFPVMTLAISKDPEGNFIDPDFVKWVCSINSEKCLGNMYVGEPTSYSSCCRLKLDLAKSSSLGYTNSFGVGGLSIGSHRCAGINLPRMALLEKDNPNIFEETTQCLHNILASHRKLIEHNIESGTLPLYTSGWISLKRQYSTVGFVGMHEYFKNKGLKATDESAIVEGVKLLKKIESKLIHWQEIEGTIWNCEQIPAESQAVKLCQLDTILGYNPNKFDLYSNQYLPLWEEASIYDRFKLQGTYDSLTSGGAILHITLHDAEALTPDQFFMLLNQARKSGTTYFAINRAFVECASGHYSIGKQKECPACKEKIVNEYTRVVGYLSKVSAWNKVRRMVDYPGRHSYDNTNILAEIETNA